VSLPKLSSQRVLGKGEREGRGENVPVTDFQASTPGPDIACPKRFLPLNYCTRRIV